jgi:antitoxin CcdA
MPENRWKQRAIDPQPLCAYIIHMIDGEKLVARAFASPIFDARAPKKPTNVSINADLLHQAKELKINLSRTLEERLIDLVGAERRRRWLAENESAIADYNDRMDRDGVFSNGLRRF